MKKINQSGRIRMERALRLMYERLAEFMIENLDLTKVSVILEAGCGSGQLTLPLFSKIKKIKENFKYVAFDISAGPYEGDLEILKERIQKERQKKLIVPIKGDVRNMKAIEDESIDLIISNELFHPKRGLEIREIICKPRTMMGPSGFYFERVH